MEKMGAKTVAELREMSAEKIAEVQYTIAGEGLPWSPAVDGRLLTDSVDALAANGKIHDIPYMIGSCGDDMGADVQLLEKAAARWGKNQLALGRTPTYLYLFDRKLPGDDAGAFHSSELWFVFHTLERAWRPWEPCDYVLQQQMSAY